MDFKNQITEYLDRVAIALSGLNIEEINESMNIILNIYEQKKNIYVFGNGGSAATASHIVCDFNKGISDGKKIKFRVLCLNDNTPTLLAIANDIGYEEVFAYQLKGRLEQDDLVIAISGSGNSINVIKAVEYAKTTGAKVVGMTGYDGGKLRKLADYNLHANIDDMQITEDIHMLFDHMIMQIFKRELSDE